MFTFLLNCLIYLNTTNVMKEHQVGGALRVNYAENAAHSNTKKKMRREETAQVLNSHGGHKVNSD